MSKIVWKPGTMLYPVPAVLVTSTHGKSVNVFTVSWIGTICTDPPMLSVSIRPERFSYDLIKKSGEFVVNLPGQDLAFAVDFCGVKSGRDIDKFAELKLHIERGSIVKAPIIKECLVAIEARVKSVQELGSHHMFLAEVVAVNVEERLIDKNGKLHLENAGLLCYNHGHYYSISKSLGKFGFSVQKKKNRRRSK
jgi:flavin reductase (DIM6/NTAB) family NADH-FMN oxidoreductase RutF